MLGIMIFQLSCRVLIFCEVFLVMIQSFKQSVHFIQRLDYLGFEIFIINDRFLTNILLPYMEKSLGDISAQ
jgi:hypothetical protein